MSQFNLILLISITSNLIFYFFLNQISEKIDIFDIPNNKRKIHKTKVPLIGGIIFFINIIFYLFIEKFFFIQNFNLNINYLIISITSILF